MALVSLWILVFLYVIAIFCEFFAPYVKDTRDVGLQYHPPHRIRMFHAGKIRMPFVYETKKTLDPKTFSPIYRAQTANIRQIRLFVRGNAYKLLGIIESDIHLIGVNKGKIFLAGTDELGRDIFSRSLYAVRISLFIGFAGVAISFTLGIILGGVSGYFGGSVDIIIQRIIEIILSLPTIPLWMALSAALPPHWSPIKVFFGISIILSLFGWCGLARVVRGKFLEVKTADFVMAAQFAGMKHHSIIFRHLVPSFLSYLIVQLTIFIPRMIIAETALSYLGLGIRAPSVSLGTLLQSAQNVRAISMYSWMLLPAVFVIIIVLCFSAIGDGLRDAADPYSL